MIARPVSFFPPVTGGKYHAVVVATEVAACNGRTLIDLAAAPIALGPGAKPHPIVCKTCASTAGAADYPNRTRS